MNNNQRIEQEHAVSPVVGVMLMLVVTIIIAAVVSAFAGGMSSGAKQTPQASIEVKISNNTGTWEEMGGGPTVDFKLLSGDPIPTKDLAIITYYTNSTGGTYKHEQTASSPGSDLFGAMDYDQYCAWGYTQYCGIGNDVHAYGRAPTLNDMRYGYGGSFVTGDGTPVTGDVGGQHLYSDFGNFTWKTGDIMSASGIISVADLLGINDDASPHGILPEADFKPGNVVDVKILYIPSGQYIFDKEVVVS